MKRPMTTAELFEKIEGILKEKGLLPDILEYSLPEREEWPISTYKFCIRNNLDYGGSEGIYLDLWIEWREERCIRRVSLGTFKTLETDRKAMRIMAQLLADFIVEAKKYVDDHLDDFTWEGFDVYAYDEKGEQLGWGYTCPDIKEAVNRKDMLLERYSKVSIRDNATRKKAYYGQK